MGTLAIVLVACLTVVLLLVVAGVVVRTRKDRLELADFKAGLTAVDHALAAARAEDKGWDRTVLEAAAEKAFKSDYVDLKISNLVLTSVVDLPGTDEDRATFNIVASGQHFTLTLGRSSGEWHSEKLRRT